MRKEKDFIGERFVPAKALYGIHALRATENFPDSTAFHKEWYSAVGTVKMACYQSYLNFSKAVRSKYGLLPGTAGDENETLPLQLIPDQILKHLLISAREVAEGMHFEHFIVPAVQGGAGTSMNMNVNEIIANLSLLSMGEEAGNYHLIDPIEHANVFQSTNDVIPTALKVAGMRLLMDLERVINELRAVIEEQETATRNDLRIAYTQLQEAVPSSYGRLFSTYSDALSRDWWRVSKCFERIKIVNLGGGAIGTGMGLPRFYIMDVVQELQSLTGLPLTRAENLQDATANLDAYVEVHGILKAHAVNLEKIVADIRLLASDIVGNAEVTIPQKQMGSTIMPAKVNPVVPEFVISAAHKVYANDVLISSLCSQSQLDLNAYLPLIGHALLDSLKLLIACNVTMRENLFTGMFVNSEKARQRLYLSPALTTALSPYIGYHKAAEVAEMMKKMPCDIFFACREMNILPEEKLIEILKPENLLKTGFSLSDPLK